MISFIHNPMVLLDGSNPVAEEFLKRKLDAAVDVITLHRVEFYECDSDIRIVYDVGAGIRELTTHITAHEYADVVETYIENSDLVSRIIPRGFYCVELKVLGQKDQPNAAFYYDNDKDEVIHLFTVNAPMTVDELREEVHRRYPADDYYIQFEVTADDGSHDEWKSFRLHPRQFKVTTHDDEVIIEEQLVDESVKYRDMDGGPLYVIEERWLDHGTYWIPGDESIEQYVNDLLDGIVSGDPPEGSRGDLGGGFNIIAWDGKVCIKNRVLTR